MIKILIETDPIPLARTRISGKRCYQPARNLEYRKEVQWAGRLAMKSNPLLRGELRAHVKLYRKYRRCARQFGDVDNHLKAIFDGLTGICFVDDSQIVTCTVEKHTDKENPRAEIFLSEVKVL